MGIGLLFYAAVGLLIYFFVKGIRKKKAPKLILPEETKPEKRGTQTSNTENFEDVVRIYRSEQPIQAWCCPNCQCENDLSRSNCCVCNYRK